MPGATRKLMLQDLNMVAGALHHATGMYGYA